MHQQFSHRLPQRRPIEWLGGWVREILAVHRLNPVTEGMAAAVWAANDTERHSEHAS